MGHQVFHNWLHSARSAIFAPTCVLCHAPASLDLDLCHDCLADLPRQERACANCALTLPTHSHTDQCAECLKRPRFDNAIAAFEYAAPVDWLITRLKFNHRLSHARLLGALLAQHIAATSAPLPDSVVPAPLHARRYRERGYNQSALIARHTAQALSLTVTPNLAARSRDTAPQRSLPASQRKKRAQCVYCLS